MNKFEKVITSNRFARVMKKIADDEDRKDPTSMRTFFLKKVAIPMIDAQSNVDSKKDTKPAKETGKKTESKKTEVKPTEKEGTKKNAKSKDEKSNEVKKTNDMNDVAVEVLYKDAKDEKTAEANTKTFLENLMALVNAKEEKKVEKTDSKSEKTEKTEKPSSNSKEKSSSPSTSDKADVIEIDWLGRKFLALLCRILVAIWKSESSYISFGKSYPIHWPSMLSVGLLVYLAGIISNSTSRPQIPMHNVASHSPAPMAQPAPGFIPPFFGYYQTPQPAAIPTTVGTIVEQAIEEDSIVYRAGVTFVFICLFILFLTQTATGPPVIKESEKTKTSSKDDSKIEAESKSDSGYEKEKEKEKEPKKEKEKEKEADKFELTRDKILEIYKRQNDKKVDDRDNAYEKIALQLKKEVSLHAKQQHQELEQTKLQLQRLEEHNAATTAAAEDIRRRQMAALQESRNFSLNMGIAGPSAQSFPQIQPRRNNYSQTRRASTVEEIYINPQTDRKFVKVNKTNQGDRQTFEQSENRDPREGYGFNNELRLQKLEAKRNALRLAAATQKYNNTNRVKEKVHKRGSVISTDKNYHDFVRNSSIGTH
ncbi:hypothetical protein BVG19_g4654 [[Candida] boidinii]|nr:hypothetical protein BVG19_g4654 [[Candida] boidinii]OWB50082.1 hypothetical protein B5S27_g1629 [[Candida] boidinii]